MSLTWIGSGGGPLLLLPRDLLADWYGFDDLSPHHAPASPVDVSDYDRACRIAREYLARIDVGAGGGIVLGDEPLDTTYVEQPGGTAVIVRWVFANARAEAEDELSRLPPPPEAQGNVDIVTGPDGLVLFDAACSGSDILNDNCPYLTIALAPGTYRADTMSWEPRTDSRFLLHHLRGA